MGERQSIGQTMLKWRGTRLFKVTKIEGDGGGERERERDKFTMSKNTTHTHVYMYIHDEFVQTSKILVYSEFPNHSIYKMYIVHVILFLWTSCSVSGT